MWIVTHPNQSHRKPPSTRSSDVDSNGDEDESHDDEFAVMRHLSLFDDRELTGISPTNATLSPPDHEVDPAASSVNSHSKKDKVIAWYACAGFTILFPKYGRSNR